jgi:hypothetical protein
VITQVVVILTTIHHDYYIVRCMIIHRVYMYIYMYQYSYYIVTTAKTKTDYILKLKNRIGVVKSKSAWVIALRQLSNFSAISWWEQVNFQWDDDEDRFVLNQHAELDFYSASSLKQQSAGRHVAPLGHIILLCFFIQINSKVFNIWPHRWRNG